MAWAHGRIARPDGGPAGMETMKVHRKGALGLSDAKDLGTDGRWG